jgi:hypothetical protein
MEEMNRVKITLVDGGRFEVRLRTTDGHHLMVTRSGFAPGDVVSPFGAREVVPGPTRHSLQVGYDEHILLAPEYLQYMNHSCRPNIIIDTEKRLIRAIRPIVSGDELLFFYPATEWDMESPFKCHCGAPECLSVINGARHISPEVLLRYDLAPHIELRLNMHPAAVAASQLHA